MLLSFSSKDQGGLVSLLSCYPLGIAGHPKLSDWRKQWMPGSENTSFNKVEENVNVSFIAMKNTLVLGANVSY